MAAVRLTKAERELIRTLVNGCEPKQRRVADGLLEKLAASEVPRKKEGPSVHVVIEVFRGVLGRRLITPPAPSPAWYAQQSAQLARMGMTVELCRRAAQVAAEVWQGPIRAESIIRQADKLLHEQAYEPRGAAVYVDLADEEL